MSSCQVSAFSAQTALPMEWQAAWNQCTSCGCEMPAAKGCFLQGLQEWWVRGQADTWPAACLGHQTWASSTSITTLLHLKNVGVVENKIICIQSYGILCLYLWATQIPLLLSSTWAFQLHISRCGDWAATVSSCSCTLHSTADSHVTDQVCLPQNR